MLKDRFKCLAGILLVIGLVLSISVSGTAIEVGEVPQDVEEEFIYEPAGIEVESWVQGLEIPWQLIFLPESDRALVTERPGRIRLIENGELRSDVYADINAAHYGEGGLMGIDYHPDFPEEPYLYIMYTYQNQAGDYYNRISRLTDYGDSAGDEEVILDEIPAGQNHNGGRLKFGPDSKLYATAGDTWRRQLAQDLDSLAGKILRLNPDGTIPEDNPFEDSYIYSLGHRNPQGLAWNQEGVLFISDHGPSGEAGLQNKDMIKVIEPGGNYGWPERIGYFGDDQYLDPIVMWPYSVPPAGAEFVDGEVFIATLRSRALIKLSLEKVAQYDYNVT
ncbi:MAG: sorbosone dehydrogenase family protein, partial [Halarsenatibacteraceae bacterium]